MYVESYKNEQIKVILDEWDIKTKVFIQNMDTNRKLLEFDQQETKDIIILHSRVCPKSSQSKIKNHRTLQV